MTFRAPTILPDGWTIISEPRRVSLFGVEYGWCLMYAKDSDILIVYIVESTGKVIDWKYMPHGALEQRHNPSVHEG